MRRIFALVQAAWLALLIAEPASLHACAMHATGHGSHAVAAAPAGEVRAPALDAHHQHHATHDGSAVAVERATVATDAQPETEQGATSHCQCLGECCAAAATALATKVSLVEARVVTVAVYAPDAHERIAARSADLRLPFANAPPVALTA